MLSNYHPGPLVTWALRRRYQPSLRQTTLLTSLLWALTTGTMAFLISTERFLLPYLPANIASLALAFALLLMILALAMTAAYSAGSALAGPVLELAARGVPPRERLIFTLIRAGMRVRLGIAVAVGTAPLIAVGPVTGYQYTRMISSMFPPPRQPLTMLALPLLLTLLTICLLGLGLACGVWAGLRWGADRRARIAAPLLTVAWAALPMLLLILIQPYTGHLYPWRFSLTVLRVLLAMILALLPALFGLWTLRLTLRQLDMA